MDCRRKGSEGIKGCTFNRCLCRLKAHGEVFRRAQAAQHAFLSHTRLSYSLGKTSRHNSGYCAKSQRATALDNGSFKPGQRDL